MNANTFRVESLVDAMIIGVLAGLLFEVPSWKWAALMLGYFVVSLIAKMIDTARA